MRFCEIGTCREHGLCRRAREGDPSVYVGAKGAVCCTVRYKCPVIGGRLVEVGWMACLVGCAVSGMPERLCGFVGSFKISSFDT
jgi:hypothetical protein